jgi:ABC-type sugar transport system permease subunit
LYIWFFRSLPLIVLLLILYNFNYFYPTLSIGIPFGPAFGSTHTTALFTSLFMGVLGLSLNEAAYAAELVRGGILSVDQGQMEAANALGLSRTRQLRRIILPQALRTIIPGYVNQIIGLIKSSSLVYYVSLLADAINHLINNGQYATWLKAYGLSKRGRQQLRAKPAGVAAVQQRNAGPVRPGIDQMAARSCRLSHSFTRTNGKRASRRRGLPPAGPSTLPRAPACVSRAHDRPV